MVESIFNSKDAKYKCCFGLIHVKTVASIICALSMFWHFLSIIDFFAYKHASFLTVVWLFLAIFSLFIFGTAMSGIIHSKPEYIQLAVYYMIGRLITSAFLTLIFFGAHMPTSLIEEFCRYLYKKITGFKDQSEYQTTDYIGNVLLHFVISLMLIYWAFGIMHKCHKYYTDKAAADALSLPNAAVPPPQAPLIKTPA